VLAGEVPWPVRHLEHQRARGGRLVARLDQPGAAPGQPAA
jgi:hypothetical protein